MGKQINDCVRMKQKFHQDLFHKMYYIDCYINQCVELGMYSEVNWELTSGKNVNEIQLFQYS